MTYWGDIGYDGEWGCHGDMIDVICQTKVNQDHLDTHLLMLWGLINIKNNHQRGFAKHKRNRKGTAAKTCYGQVTETPKKRSGMERN